MKALSRTALLLGAGVLAAAPAAGRAEEPRASEARVGEVWVDAVEAVDHAPATTGALPSGEAEASARTPSNPLRGGAEPDQTLGFAPAAEFEVPGTEDTDEPAAPATDPTPVPAALPAGGEAPSLVLDEPTPSAPVADPTTTGSGPSAAAQLPAAAPPAPADGQPSTPAPSAQAAPIQAVPAQAAPAQAVPAQQAAPGQAGTLPQQNALPQQAAPARQAGVEPSTPADPVAAALAVRLADERPLHARLAKRERDAVAAFYAIGNYQPLWIKDGAWTPAASRVAERLRRAPEDALDAAPLPSPGPGTDPAGLAEAELALTAAAVLYARDARGARIEPSRLSGLITPKLELPAADAVLTQLAAAPDAGAALQAYNPPHAGYLALRAKLAELRAARPGQPLAEVPDGPVLRPGMQDPRVPLIRARLNLGPAADGAAYDEEVAGAVAAFQRENGLKADGQLTRQTVAALQARSPSRREADLIANMERWRWLPGELGARHILVNIPEYRLRIVDGGQVVHQTRVVVGKPETPTPVFTGAMDHAIVNPSWFVPPSILNKEFRGADGQIAAKAGYEVIRRGNQVSVRQPPGPRNALGNIKFMFPNQHAVYLHDTPSRHLFSAERRAFSHGCVRVDQPFALGAQLLGADGWSEARLKGLVGHGERTIKLSGAVPVHITYFTLQADEFGELRALDDLYGHNARVRRALGLGGEAPPTIAAPKPPRQAAPQAARPPARKKPAQAAQPAQLPVQAQAQPAPSPVRSLFGWLTR